MGNVTKQQVVEYVAGLRLGEVQHLVEALEERLGVSAAPVAPSLPQVLPPPEVVEPTEFDVVLEGYADGSKLPVIRAVRSLTGLGLRDAKQLVEAAPHAVREALPRAEAEAARATLRAAGAEVTLR